MNGLGHLHIGLLDTCNLPITSSIPKLHKVNFLAELLSARSICRLDFINGDYCCGDKRFPIWTTLEPIRNKPFNQ